MRVWVDITKAADVVFFAPIIRRLEDSDHTVTVTARRFVSAEAIAHRYGIGALLLATHHGGNLAARAVGLANRTRELLVSAAGGDYEVAVGSHSSDFVLAGWTLGIPQMTFLEDDGLRRVAAMGMRFADQVAVPDAIAASALTAFRPAPRRFVRYPGYREEYYLHDVRPDLDALRPLTTDARTIVGVVQPAESDDASSAESLVGLARVIGGRRNIRLVVVARSYERAREFVNLVPTATVLARSVDRASALAAADFVISNEGIALREASALGTPAYTVRRQILSAVDRALVRSGRLAILSTADDLVLRRKDVRTVPLESRDPQMFVEEILALARRRPRRARAGGLGDLDGAAP